MHEPATGIEFACPGRPNDEFVDNGIPTARLLQSDRILDTPLTRTRRRPPPMTVFTGGQQPPHFQCDG